MAFPYIAENAVSRRRLETIVESLTAAELARTTEYGWTVSALLAHLAFWDNRVLALLRRREAAGGGQPPGASRGGARARWRAGRGRGGPGFHVPWEGASRVMAGAGAGEGPRRAPLQPRFDV